MSSADNAVALMYSQAAGAVLDVTADDPVAIVETSPETTLSLTNLGAYWHGLWSQVNPRSALWLPPKRSVKGILKRVALRLVGWFLWPMTDSVAGFHAKLLTGLGNITEALQAQEQARGGGGADLKALAARLEKKSAYGFPEDAAFAFDYPRFEWQHRGSRELVKDLQREYVELFAGQEDVVDLGAGRGEFVEILREAGISARGVEGDPRQADYCAGLGLPVEAGDMFAFLRRQPKASLGGIFLGQVVEHISPSELLELVRLARTRLRPGGCFVAETPNPECLFIFHSFFYVDPTHFRPVHPATLRYILELQEFSSVEIIPKHPVPEEIRLEMIPEEQSWAPAYNRNVDRLNRVVFSYQDYAAVARV